MIVFRLLDPAEKDFTFRQPARFRDMETGEEVYTHPHAIREAYLGDLEKQDEVYTRVCRENAADYLSLDTGTPFDQALLTFLAKRAHLG